MSGQPHAGSSTRSPFTQPIIALSNKGIQSTQSRVQSRPSFCPDPPKTSLVAVNPFELSKDENTKSIHKPSGQTLPVPTLKPSTSQPNKPTTVQRDPQFSFPQVHQPTNCGAHTKQGCDFCLKTFFLLF